MINIQKREQSLCEILRQCFLIQPCFRCYEYRMRFIELSHNARSVYYQCVGCGKKMRAPAGTPNAPQATPILGALEELINKYNRISRSSPYKLTIEFDATPAPLPYEQTSRAPISEAIKSEVYRRDGGRCVKCGSRENLQFDHIIPVSLGGATSPQNLQLLCQQCNLAKGTSI
jgi:DNA-directed RNA polymerase subunit RPC12/RpoP